MFLEWYKMGERLNYEWKEQVGPVLNVNLFNKRIGLCFCHRKDERCFKFRGYTFPICSRCCGLYIGITLSIILLFFFQISHFLFCLLLLPLIIDGSVQYFFDWKSNNIRRFSTGLLFSIGLVYLLGVIV